MESASFLLPWKTETYAGYYVKSPVTTKNLLQQFMEEDILFGIDTETQALPEYHHIGRAALSPNLSKIRLIQIFDGENSYVLDMNHAINKNNLPLLLKFLETKRFIAHNAIFDLQFFYRLGVRHMNIGCTFILAKLLFHATYPTDEGLSASLKELCKVMLKVDLTKEAQVTDWSAPELTFEQVKYSAYDPIAVIKLAEKMAPGLEKLGLKRIYTLTKDAQHPLAKMMLNGISINTERHRAMIPVWRDKLYKAKKEVLKITGLKDITSHKIAEYLERTLPPKIRDIWPTTETGKLSTDAHTFSDFSHLEIVKPFSEFQKQEKLTSTFGNKLLAQINPATGRLHAQYKLLGARTGRLSSSSPNLQQLPRDGDIRGNFVPKPSWKFLCADYSQIELRVAAEVSRDAAMLGAYKRGIDLHKLTASTITGKRLENLTKEDRQMAKAFNFGLLFGLGAAKFSHYAKKSYGVEVTDKEARESIEEWRELYSGYREWQKSHAAKCRTTLQVRTPCGKLRRLAPDNFYGSGLNQPVQGGAAECMLYSLIFLDREFRDRSLEAQFSNVVHDELLIECPEDEVECVKHLIVNCMTDGFLEVFPKGITKGIVEVGEGYTWAEAKS